MKSWPTVLISSDRGVREGNEGREGAREGATEADRQTDLMGKHLSAASVFSRSHSSLNEPLIKGCAMRASVIGLLLITERERDNEQNV